MNNYEAPVVVQMGPAHDLILGPKPEGFIENEGSLYHQDAQSDIDEVDE